MRVSRVPRIVVQAMLIGLSIGFVYWAIVDWSLPDAGAYWQAALRLRAGQPLYPAVANVESSEVFRYAPWFAWLTVPMTFMPLAVAAVIWSVVLIAASFAAVVPLARRGALLEALFFGSVLIGISAKGNVHALLIASLVLGLERRSGPLWVALAASLKAVPVLFALVYLGRREWWRFAASVALTALLVAPFLLYDLSGYVTDPGFAGLLITWPPVYIAVGVAAVALTLWLARTRLAWLVAATTAALALPRFFVYDVTFLLPGTISPADKNERASQSEADPHGSEVSSSV